MINPHDNYWIPGEGFKYITDGTVYSTGIILGAADSIGRWRDTNDEAPSPPEPDDEATAADYEAALADLGVRV